MLANTGNSGKRNIDSMDFYGSIFVLCFRQLENNVNSAMLEDFTRMKLGVASF